MAAPLEAPSAPALGHAAPVPHSVRQHRGFTLVEVLVALFVLALMAAMAWQGIDSLARGRDAAQARMDTLMRLQSVVAQWEADLAAVADTQVVPALQFDGATLRLTRRQPQGVQIVAWSLRGDALTRWTAAPTTRAEALQETWFQSYQLLGNEPGQLRALPGVASWQMYCYRGNGWSNCQSSGDLVADAAPPPPPPPSSSSPPNPSAPPPAPSPGAAPANAEPRKGEALPTGVRMVLSFAPGSGIAGDVTRDVRLAP
jgi:general secretion pathway protein J